MKQIYIKWHLHDKRIRTCEILDDFVGDFKKPLKTLPPEFDFLFWFDVLFPTSGTLGIEWKRTASFTMRKNSFRIKTWLVKSKPFTKSDINISWCFNNYWLHLLSEQILASIGYFYPVVHSNSSRVCRKSTPHRSTPLCHPINFWASRCFNLPHTLPPGQYHLKSTRHSIAVENLACLGFSLVGLPRETVNSPSIHKVFCLTHFLFGNS